MNYETHANPIYTKVSPHSSQNDHQQNVNKQSINQDGGVEGRALTPSPENTRITNSCWTIIDRKTLELTKKDTPHPKTKEKPH